MEHHCFFTWYQSHHKWLSSIQPSLLRKKSGFIAELLPIVRLDLIVSLKANPPSCRTCRRLNPLLIDLADRRQLVPSSTENVWMRKCYLQQDWICLRVPNEIIKCRVSEHEGIMARWKNYIQWSQIVKTPRKGRGKLSHLDGTGKDDPKFPCWDEENFPDYVMVIEFDATRDQQEFACFSLLARDIWETVCSILLQDSRCRGDLWAQDKDINNKARYYFSNQMLWCYEGYLAWDGSLSERTNEVLKDANTLQEFMERDGYLKFWLEVEFDQVWIQVLGKFSCHRWMRYLPYKC